MSSSTTDRRLGLNGNTAIKAPCLVATTANITLSGEQTIDGVAVVSGDRVLVKDQTDQSTNGIYDVSTGSWTRSLDFDGNLDIVRGTLVFVNTGTVGVGYYWVTTADPITIDSSNITFTYDARLTDLAASSGSSLIGFIQSGTGAVATDLQTRGRKIIYATDFGVVGDGSTDDTMAMQNFLTAAQGKIGYIPPATYICKRLFIKSGTTLFGLYGSTIIQAHASLPTDQPLLVNTNYDGTDTNIIIDGIIFDGNNLTSRTAELVSFDRVITFDFRNSIVRNIGYIGFNIAGCTNGRISGLSRFYNCGNTVQTSEGGSAVRVADYSGIYCQNIRIEDSVFFYNNNWSALYYMNTTDGYIGGKYYNNKESVIYAYTLVNVTFNPDIDTNTIMNISANGIETGNLTDCKISGYLRNIYANAISITNSTGDVEISDVHFRNANTDRTVVRQVYIYIDSLATASANIRILNNAYREDSNNQAGFIGITATAGAANNITIKGNKNINVTLTSGEVVQYGSAQGTGWDVDYTQTCTLTATGMTTSPTGTCSYTKVSNTVTLDVPTISGTSNATTFTLTGLPSDLYPTANRQALIRTTDNGGSNTIAICTIDSSGVISLYKDVTGAAFTNTGTKSVRQSTISYPI